MNSTVTITISNIPADALECSLESVKQIAKEHLNSDQELTNDIALDFNNFFRIESFNMMLSLALTEYIFGEKMKKDLHEQKNN